MRSVRQGVKSLGTALRLVRSSVSGASGIHASSGGAESPDAAARQAEIEESRAAIARLSERLLTLENVIDGQAQSIDVQFNSHDDSLATLLALLWPGSPDTHSLSAGSPSRLDLLQEGLGRQIDQVATGLAAVSQVYGERLNSLQAVVDAVGASIAPHVDYAIKQSALSVHASVLQTEAQAMRELHGSAMSRLAAAEATFRTLEERSPAPARARSSVRPGVVSRGMDEAGAREALALSVAMDLHGLARDAARRQPDAIKAIDAFAAEFAALSVENEAVRGGLGVSALSSRPEFPAVAQGSKSSSPLAIVSVGERRVGARDEIFAPLVAAGATLHRVERGEDLSDVASADVLVIQDPNGACDVIEEAGPFIGGVFCVQARVSFAPTRRGDDYFADVDRDLQSLGFQFVDFLRTGRGSFDGTADGPIPSRLIWADAVYVRPPELIDALPAEAALRAAGFVHTAFGMYDLAARYLARYDAVAGGDAASDYRKMLKAATPADASAPQGS